MAYYLRIFDNLQGVLENLSKKLFDKNGSGNFGEQLLGDERWKRKMEYKDDERSYKNMRKYDSTNL